MLLATLKSLLSRKLRLLLSGMAVVLGVMAVSGALVLTNHLSGVFNGIFSTVSADLDVRVTSAQSIEDEEPGQRERPISADVAAKVAAVDGVAKAKGAVFAEGAKVIGENGKLTITRAPNFGASWAGEQDFLELSSGRGPRAPNEVTINSYLAEQGDYSVGDSINIQTLQPAKTFTVVGIFKYPGDRGTLFGESRVEFTEQTAQELLLGQPNAYTSVDIEAKDGVSPATLVKRIEAALGSAYDVKTGDETAEEQGAGAQAIVSNIRNVLLGFAGVALFVGIFLIINTFSIVVVQRTKELALFRSLGAGKKQIIGSVLTEATVIGVIASTLGLLAGWGAARLLIMVMEANSGMSVPPLPFSFPTTAVIASYSVGVIVTLIAALLPALRASRVPPVAAMRDVSTAEKPLGVLTIAGILVTLIGAGGIALALFADMGDALMMVLLGSVLLAFIGLTMVTPALARPTISVLGRAFAWSMPGKLGRRNSSRNPRRTAITAAALMVGITLVAGVSVLAASMKASIEKVYTSDVKAELIIGGQQNGPTPPSFDPAVLDQVRQLDGVREVATFYTDRVRADDSTVVASAVNVAALRSALALDVESGSARELQPGEVLVDDEFADKHDLTVGESVAVRAERGERRDLRVVGIFRDSEAFQGALLLPESDSALFYSPRANQSYVKLAPGTSVREVKDQVNRLLAAEPEVTASDQQAFADEQASQVDSFVMMMFILLGLALLIAILGIVNTLTLSIVERVRELGLVRAVGMRRGQVLSMVTVESMVIALFGTLLGLVAGTALGATVVGALDGVGITELAVPWTWFAGFGALAFVVGLLAAVGPAVKASRVNVLRAIAYE